MEGWSPFRRTSLESTLAAILTADAPEPQRAGALGPLLTRLLVKDPALRPDAEQAEAVLRAVADGTQPVPEAAGDVPAADAWPAPEASTGSGPAAQESRALRGSPRTRTRRLATRPATPGADGGPEGVGGREADRIPAAVRTPSNDDTPNRPGTTVEPPPPPPPTGPEAPRRPRAAPSTAAPFRSPSWAGSWSAPSGSGPPSS